MGWLALFMKTKLLTLAVLALMAVACQRFKWKEFTSTAGAFSVLLPGTPTEQTQRLNTQVGTIDVHLFILEQDNAQYLVAYNDYPDAMAQSANADKVLDGAREGVVANVRGRLVSEQRISLAAHPGRELHIKVPEGLQAMRTRLFLVKQRLYQVGVLTADGETDTKDVNKYLESFKLLAP
jgi:hypothetical protein